MEKKYFYVDNLSEYGRKLSCKLNSAHWQFAKLEDGVYCLYNKKTGKTKLSIRRGYRDENGKVKNTTIKNNKTFKKPRRKQKSKHIIRDTLM